MYPTVKEMIAEKTALLNKYLAEDAEFEQKKNRTIADFRRNASVTASITSLKRQIKLMQD
jgi:hypothetical protein